MDWQIIKWQIIPSLILQQEVWLDCKILFLNDEYIQETNVLIKFESNWESIQHSPKVMKVCETFERNEILEYLKKFSNSWRANFVVINRKLLRSSKKWKANFSLMILQK